MSLGQRIRVVRREQLGLTQRELGNLLDTDPVTVSRWERDAVEPSLRYVRQIAEIAGKPVAWFFADDSVPV